MRHWLVKSEADAYSISDLERDGVTPWDGVRNHQARNLMRDEMEVGDPVLFYHSNADPPGVAGLAEVASAPYADATQFDPSSKYFDPRSDPADPRWMLVDVRFVRRLGRVVPLPELRQDPHLEDMPLLRKGQRLSVQPVEERHFARILETA